VELPFWHLLSVCVFVRARVHVYVCVCFYTCVSLHTSVCWRLLCVRGCCVLGFSCVCLAPLWDVCGRKREKVCTCICVCKCVCVCVRVYVCASVRI